MNILLCCNFIINESAWTWAWVTVAGCPVRKPMLPCAEGGFAALTELFVCLWLVSFCCLVWFGLSATWVRSKCVVCVADKPVIHRKSVLSLCWSTGWSWSLKQVKGFAGNSPHHNFICLPNSALGTRRERNGRLAHDRIFSLYLNHG